MGLLLSFRLFWPKVTVHIKSLKILRRTTNRDVLLLVTLRHVNLCFKFLPKSYLVSNYTLMLKQCTEWRCQEGQNILGQGRGRKMVYLLWDLWNWTAVGFGLNYTVPNEKQNFWQWQIKKEYIWSHLLRFLTNLLGQVSIRCCLGFQN